MWTSRPTRQRSAEARPFRSPAARRSSRRGVLMLVVLSMLVLFMLIGTAFLMSSSQEHKTATAAAKDKRLGNNATKLLDRALLGAVRDTENPYSVIRYHSLLRDIYGTNGFQGAIYCPDKGKVNPDKINGRVTSYPGASATTPPGPRGLTNGQFIDIYVRALAWDSAATPPTSLDDPQTTTNENSGPQQLIQPDRRHILKLDRDPLGAGQLYAMPLTKGYFNGQLMTITSGPAAGQTTRILDYEVEQELSSDGITSLNFTDPSRSTGSSPVFTRIFRFRVMAFQRADGGPLQISTDTTRSQEIVDLAGVPNLIPPATFMVNGRAFSGTGVGYDPYAQIGTPRLSALEVVQMGTKKPVPMPVALLPNSVYAFLSDPNPDPAAADIRGIFDYNAVTGVATPLNPKLTTGLSQTDATARVQKWLYPSFVGLGGANESYDAADFQNMGLALQTVTPRAQGRVVQGDTTNQVTLSAVDPSVDRTKFLRLDLEDLPLPSFHRPDLVNYWFHQLLGLLTDPNGDYKLPPDLAVQSIIDPYPAPSNQLRSGLSQDAASLITAVKRKVMMRPLREDHPDFNGSNQLSTPTGLPTSQLTLGSFPNYAISIPYWEAVGPWDVDNDNDGVPDSVWVDIGDPVQEAEDGTRYKPLYAYLIVDLDSRLNVNAHGLADDIVSPLDDPTRRSFFDPNTAGNLAHDTTNTSPNLQRSTLQLSRGLGYGPAEISLRPVFPIPEINSSTQPAANRVEVAGPIDSYATVLFGRQKLDTSSIAGRYGFDPNLNYPRLSNGDVATAASNYRYSPILKTEPAWSPRWNTGEMAMPSLAAQLKFFDYPYSFDQSTYFNVLNKSNYGQASWYKQSSFGTPPDLKGRYALGLDYSGQPVFEVANDVNPNTATLPAPSALNAPIYPLNQQLPFNLLARSPYELDLTSAKRRDSSGMSFSDVNTAFTNSVDLTIDGTGGLNDDAAFSPSDLEKVLRGWDPDIGTLPSRLWDSVDAFDPLKLIRFLPNNTANFANDMLDPTNRSIGAPAIGQQASPEMMTGAQQMASINRRLVTTDSYDLPVANQTMPAYVSDFGADGVPGRRGLTGTKLNDVDTDDFQTIVGVPRAQAKIVDLLYYRVWLEARRFIMRTQGLVESGPSNSLDSLSADNYRSFLVAVKTRADFVFSRLASDLLAPEVIAGKKMDLNRPFGDGKDNNGDGVVDDPLEAGEPFLDINGNGTWDVGEPFLDLNGDGKYNSPQDGMWPQLWPAPAGNGTLAEPISFDYTQGHAEPIHAAVVKALNQTIQGGVRNLESQGRQLFARHLYCLMLLLVDENYIAPWDENDPQILTYMVNERNKLTSPNLKSPATGPPLTPAEADLVVKRKLTCRMIAQWAINVVDARDPDSIMTPFEYDENPWDGWGVWDDNWIGDLGDNKNKAAFKIQKDPTKATFFPLDGDPATDENNGWVIDWSLANSTNKWAKTLTQLLVKQSQPVNLDTTSQQYNPPLITHPLLQTRGVVWGAERPELLMTETFAFHDRRVEDLQGLEGMNGFIKDYDSKTDTQHTKDPDGDQRLRPRGSLFVELYNPWSPQGQFPAELYSRLDSTTGYVPKYYSQAIPQNPNQKDGVELGRLSNYAWDENNNKLTLDPTTVSSTVNIKRSPVWRILVVEEWPTYRNSDEVDGKRSDETFNDTYKNSAGFKSAQTIYNAARDKVKAWNPTISPTSPFRPSDPDFDAGFSAGFLPKQKANGQNVFEVQFPWTEREFYFTTDKSPLLNSTQIKNLFDHTPDHDYSKNVFKLRLPYRTVKITYGTDAPQTSPLPKQGQMQRFISPDLELSTNRPATDEPIAPIAPGRYGVIGSAGARYSAGPIDTGLSATPFVTAVGRKNDSTIKDGDTPKPADVMQTRRIELHPSNNSEWTQVVIGGNGGDPKDEVNPSYLASGVTDQLDPTTVELGRDNEMMFDQALTKVKNVTQPAADGTAQYYQPSVAIPVAGMNVSEPAWGYSAREYEAAEQEKKAGKPPQIYTFKYDTTKGNYEGHYYASDSDGSENPNIAYDKPLDGSFDRPVAPEMMRVGTVPNYRTLHLQRLANPTLPWNPPPGQFFEPAPTAVNPAAQSDMYRPNMPINPYRTIDTASVNVTAFNGASENAESSYPKDSPAANAQVDFLQMRPWVITEQDVNATNSKPGYAKGFKDGKQVFAFRSSERGGWARLNMSGVMAPSGLPSQQRVLWAQEPAMTTLSYQTPANVTQRALFDLTPNRSFTMMQKEVAGQIRTDESIQPNHVDMVMEQTLGFGNKSFGLLFDKRGAIQPARVSSLNPQNYSALVNSVASSTAPTPASIGSPAPFNFTWDTSATNDTKDHPDNKVKLEMKAAVTSTNPWLAWNNRPYVSAEELMNVPMASQAALLKQYSTSDPNALPANRPNPYGLSEMGVKPTLANSYLMVFNAVRWATIQAPFGQLPNVFASSSAGLPGSAASQPADVVRDWDLNPTSLPSGYVVSGVPVRFDRKTGNQILPDAGPTTDADPRTDGDVRPYGAPNFYRILDYVQVPSRFVGTDTMLNAETFNDVPGVDDSKNIIGSEVGSDITGPTDPRLNFQPPFNKVSLERDPGKVNLNTVTGRRIPSTATAPAQIWSEVYDGIMHRIHDANSLATQLAQPGPAWRDVVLSRRGYVQFNAATTPPPPQPTPVDKPGAGPPDVFQFGLNPLYPTIFANPFRSSDAGDLVPLPQMMQFGVDASLLRKHPYDRAPDAKGVFQPWGPSPMNFGDTRDAGFGANEIISAKVTPATFGAIPNDDPLKRDILPLFSEARGDAFSDTTRNPYMMYQPMSRLGNLVTNHSNVYAVWITVGYFEVEKAPDWNDPDANTRATVQARFGGDGKAGSPATIAAQALYNRVYPDGYMLGKELGSDTGDIKRPRGFYIIDRTEPVGFQPGEDLNVEKMIRLRRRIQ